MVEFLRTSKISSHIEDIIVDAKEHITFVTPYLKFTKTLYERLIEKDDEGVKIRFIYGKTKLMDDQEQLLRRLKNISIYFLENLHAKSYINESAGIVTSMNLYDFSEKNNREMGIFFRRTDNESLYSEVLAEVESIIKASTLQYQNAPHSVNRSERMTPDSNQIQQNPTGGMMRRSNQAQDPQSITYTQRLCEKLQQEYRQSRFQYIPGGDKIICENFSEFFELQLEPRGGYFRIDFRLTAKDYKTRQNHYYMLYDNRYDVQKHFPPNVVVWGSQMKRIKFDFPQDMQSLAQLDVQVYFELIQKAHRVLREVLETTLRTFKAY